MAPALTNSEILKEVQQNDNTLHITGYVTAITGQRKVGQKRCLNLFKFVVTNGEFKMYVLIWEDQIPLYASLVKFHEVIEFVNVKAVAVDQKYHKIEQGFLDFDLSIQRSTKLIFHGSLENTDLPLPSVPEIIQIKYAAAYVGRKTIEGYLCVPFVRITTGQGTCSFASGAVSDGSYKLRLQVANYAEILALVPGAHVSMTGDLKKIDQGGPVYLQLEHMAEIKLIDRTLLSVSEIEQCFRKPLSELPPSTSNERIECEAEIGKSLSELPPSTSAERIEWGAEIV